jgi:hypothetical protein
MPILVAVHCFGCTAQIMVSAFGTLAAARGMILVAPEESEPGGGFNGGKCCGAAATKRPVVGTFQLLSESPFGF